ncbi:MAG: hypothetical protein V2I97_22815 [Desulfococcaceae bacterium]|jgi:hypothetical protein|nr:hypothetical protein [Desulfococcaceae bacterium]
MILKNGIQYFITIFVLLFVSQNNPVFGENSESYWTDISDLRINKISVAKEEETVIRFHAEVPAGKILKAYSFSIFYDSQIISVVSVITSPGSDFPPAFINNQNPGQIVFNGFSLKGVAGERDLSFIDIRIRAIAGGNFYFSAVANSFGSSASEQFFPIADDLPVFAFSGTVIPGDMDNNGRADLKDAVPVLQVLSGEKPVRPLSLEAEVDGNGRVGVEEAVYILQFSAGLRNIPGDINGNGSTDLADAVLVFRILTGHASDIDISVKSDTDGNGRIGMEEGIFILQKVAGKIF